MVTKWDEADAECAYTLSTLRLPTVTVHYRHTNDTLVEKATSSLFLFSPFALDHHVFNIG